MRRYQWAMRRSLRLISKWLLPFLFSFKDHQQLDWFSIPSRRLSVFFFCMLLCFLAGCEAFLVNYSIKPVTSAHPLCTDFTHRKKGFLLVRSDIQVQNRDLCIKSRFRTRGTVFSVRMQSVRGEFWLCWRSWKSISKFKQSELKVAKAKLSPPCR